MAKADSQGIMALPAQGAPDDTGASALPQMGLDDSYDAMQQGLQNASPQASDAVNAELAKLSPQLDQLPDQALDMLLQIIQYMHDNPDKYAECVKKLVDAGIIQEGDFPAEYDPEFLATIGMVVMHAKKSRQGGEQSASTVPTPPPGMARGGIAEAAHMVASRGRGQDTMLAHITPKEAKMLKSKGGMGTINPATGLPEYGFFDSVVSGFTDAVSSVGKAAGSVVSGIGNAVKNIVSSPIGKVLGTVALATFLGPGAFGISGLGLGATASMAVASGAMTALGGGNIGDVLKSAAIGGATAFFAAPGGVVSNFVHGAVSNAAANAAITSGIVGTGIGLLSGQKLQDAVKSGLTAGAVSGLATGATKGFGAQIEAPKIANVADMATSSAAAPSAASASNLPAGAQPVPGATVVENGVTYQKYSMPDGTFTYRPEAGASVNAASAAPVRNADGSTTAFLGRATPDANGQPPSVTYGNAPAAPVATDPLGDFIQQNDMQRAAASMPAQEPSGIGALWDKTKGIYHDYISPSGIQENAVPNAEAAGQAAYDRLANAPESIRAAAYQRAYDAAMPGVVSTYGPAVGVGLGIAGLAGAFTPKPPQPTEEEQAMNARLQAERDRVAANPGNYVPKGLEKYGIVYNDRGEIVGSNPWNPAPAPGTTEVAGNYMAYKPSPYMTPSGAIGGTQPIYQPFNTASMYTNLMPPQYRADGGIASLATGGYPRRTGPISGPGTETSDSIPAMLSDGEFVMTAKAVRGAGKGSRLAGAKKMYALMHQLERNAARG